MSDFIVIIPDDPTWIQMPAADVGMMLSTVADVGSIMQYCQGDLFNLSLLLRDAALIGEQATLTAGQLLSSGNNEFPYLFWYKL
jgi:hypothetical protein